MSDNTEKFWRLFHQGQMSESLMLFSSFNDDEQLSIFQALFQQSGHSNKPFMISVLRRKLHKDQSFADFYSSWLPEENACQATVTGGQLYQQHFPVSTRVINGVKIDAEQEIISVGMTWVKNDEEKKGLMTHIEAAKRGDDPKNDVRHDKIKQVADGELLGLFLVQSDDNLGSPF